MLAIPQRQSGSPNRAVTRSLDLDCNGVRSSGLGLPASPAARSQICWAGVSQSGCDIFFDTDLAGIFTEILDFPVGSSKSQLPEYGHRPCDP